MTFIILWKKLLKKKVLKKKVLVRVKSGTVTTDPQRCKVVVVKGKEAYKVIAGAGRENITTLAIASAAVRALDTLIIFSGENLQSIWRGEKQWVDDNGFSDLLRRSQNVPCCFSKMVTLHTHPYQCFKSVSIITSQS